MIGAIFGDIAGSVYEFTPCTDPDKIDLFRADSYFTDDTVLTVAVADALMSCTSIRDTIMMWVGRYPESMRSYGGRFWQWFCDGGLAPYGSMGNGSAMRVSPAGWLATSRDQTIAMATQSAIITHNHPKGVKGAVAVAEAIWLARTDVLTMEMTRLYPDAARLVADLRDEAQFDETCPGSVPAAIACALQSGSVEDAVRNAISLGADAATQGAIAGSIAEAMQGIPASVHTFVRSKLPLEILAILDRFIAVAA